jgi:hypothetical protein
MKIIGFFFIILSIPIYASGNDESATEYTDLGVIIVEAKKPFIIPLSYVKPRGIDKAPILDITCIVFDKLIVDGKEIKRKRLYLSEKMFVDRRNVEEVSVEEEERFIEMEWFVETTKNGKTEILDLIYNSETGDTLKREQYTIPYGAKEIFLTYRIRIPIHLDWKVVDFFHTDPKTVRWEIEWSIGNIKKPDTDK